VARAGGPGPESGRHAQALLGCRRTSTTAPQTHFAHPVQTDRAYQLSFGYIKVVALADLFEDRLDRTRGELAKLGIDIARNRCFTGFDAYNQLLEIPEINYVILATPPHFQPVHPT